MAMAAPSLLVLIMNCAVHGPPPALPGMRSFGTAVKSSKLLGGVEKTVFECVSCCNEDSVQIVTSTLCVHRRIAPLPTLRLI